MHNLEQISLRPMTIEDTDMVISWRNSKKVRSKFLYREPLTREVHWNWIHTKIEPGFVVQFIVELENTYLEESLVPKGRGAKKEPIGSTYLRDINREEGTAEFGIFFGEDAPSGKGYGTEAQKLTLAYGFHELKLERIYARILADNEASIKIHRKNGFEIIPGKEEQLFLDGEQKTVVFLVCEKKTFLDKNK